MKTEWICTDPDNEQYGRQISERIFEFKERSKGLYEDGYEEGEFIEMTINLDHYTQEEVLNHISAYYEDLNEIFNIYGEDANWIIAECIFEQESENY